uniref:helicase-related protein n=1 Tax=uncultured Aeromicrobium sp. TaxID=337820 RepID=UPI0025D26721
IIFSRTKRAAQRLADDLADRGFPASPLHGDMAQKAREKALQGFRDGKVNILVATDVAARGIDVAGITHVINYTCPEDDKTYVHRIGRTGRAGASGTAVTFVDWADVQRWKLINKALDLPFDEPEETYSTSEHLFRDLGIDPTVSGRLKPAAPKEKKKDDAPSGSAGGSSRNRNRTRRRSGSGDGKPADRPEQTSASTSDTASEGENGQPRRRRRRRRRSGGSGSQGEASSHASASSD